MHPPAPTRGRSSRGAGRRTSLAALSLLLGSCGDAGGDTAPSGVLLISIDSLRADHLSCYGYRPPARPEILTSPSIDERLADQGMLFEQAVSTTSWTLPAHMALLTGLPNELHRVRDYPDRLHESTPYLAQLFAKAGWRTGGFYSGPNLHPVFGFGRGFEVYADCSTSSVRDTEIFEEAAGSEQARSALRELHHASHKGTSGPEIAAALSGWLDSVGEEERFFAFAHLWDVHYDYTPPKEFDLFDPDYRGDIDGRGFEELLLKDLDPADLQRLISLYDGEIRFTDHVIDGMLDELERRGRLDDTLVVVTSDHGEEFTEHGGLGHRNTLFEEVIRIPLLMRWPARIPAASSTAALASLTDVAPTILELCELARPARMWGRSLVPAMDGELPHRNAPVELTTRRLDLELRGLRGANWKAIRQLDGVPWFVDLEEDPAELHYQSARTQPQWSERAQFVQHTWEGLDKMAQRYSTATTGSLSAELQKDLAAAGYAGFEDEEPERGDTDG